MSTSSTKPQQSAPDAHDNPALQQFLHRWHTYRKVVDNNYLSHREAYGALHDYLLRHCPQAFRFTDLACGDASSCALALNNTAICSYVGVDLSVPALALAKSSLQSLPCEVTLTERDFAEYMASRTDPADIIWVGLSLHHLAREQKQQLFDHARRLITVNGSLLIYEPTLNADESHDEFMRHTEHLIHETWLAMTRAERDEIFEHISCHDHPEPASSWRQLGMDAGFNSVAEIYTDPTNMYRLYAYRG